MSAAVTYDGTLGAMFLGVIISGILYGTTVAQAVMYYRDYYNDAVWLKILVACLMTAESAHMGLITHSIYVYTITHYNDPSFLGQVVWSIVVEVLFNALTALFAQIFFVYRIYHLSNRNKTLTGIISVLVVAQFIAYTVYVIQGLPIHSLVKLGQQKAEVLTPDSLTVLTDVLITVSLVILLHRAKTGYKNTDSMVTRLIVFTINTGALTTLCAFLNSAFLLGQPHTLVYLAIFYALGRLYSNSLLGSLNSRKSYRGVGEGDEEVMAMSRISQPSQNISIQVGKTGAADGRDSPAPRLDQESLGDLKRSATRL